MQKVCLLLVGGLLFTACQPRDVYVDNMKERLSQGKVIEASAPGERLESCPTDKEDWDEALLTEAELAVAVNKVSSKANTKSETSSNSKTIFLYGAGTYVCHRVGNKVHAVYRGDRTNTKVAEVWIRKISVVKLSELYRNSEKIFGKNSSVNASSLEKEIVSKKLLKPNHQGVIHLVEVEYVMGSAPNEKSILAKAEFEKAEQGKTLTSCKSAWSSLDVPLEFHDSIFNKGLRSWVRAGDLNCLMVDPSKIIDLKVSHKSTEVCGKVKVTGVVKIRLEALEAEDLALGSEDYNEILKNVKADPRLNGYVTVTDFEFVEGSAVTCTQK